jgi:hypothetical protein
MGMDMPVSLPMMLLYAIVTGVSNRRARGARLPTEYGRGGTFVSSRTHGSPRNERLMLSSTDKLSLFTDSASTLDRKRQRLDSSPVRTRLQRQLRRRQQQLGALFDVQRQHNSSA